MLVQFHVLGNKEGVYYPHFIGEEMEAQRREATHLRSQLTSGRARDSNSGLYNSQAYTASPFHAIPQLHISSQFSQL